MLIVTSEQMKQIESRSLDYSLSYERLMENAGSAVAAVMRRTTEVEGRFVTLFCGCGNNGGDGFVAARRLAEAGANVAVILTDGAPRTPQAQMMLERLEHLEIAVVEYGADAHYLTERLAETDLLVDAVYGTGFHGELDERHRDICRLMNGIEAMTFSIDIPTGITANTGFADYCAVRADITIVLDSDKPATVLACAQEYCGRVVLTDIGIPDEAREGILSSYILVEEELVFQTLQKRRRDTHKGDYGKLLNLAGCQQYMGAAVLSTLAAMRTGAGYVTLASTKEVCRTVLPLLPEAVMLALRQTAEGGIAHESADVVLAAVEKSSAVLMGNGIGTGFDTCRLMCELLETAKCPVIIDGDGINAVSQNIDILRKANCEVVLTPHPMELSRLTGIPVAQLKQDALSAGLSFAQEYGVTLVLKDAYTTTVTPQGTVYINTTGNAGLAKAGSGDVLAGIIAALAAQRYPCALAAACGVWLHGRAGDYAAQSRSQYGMLARDVIELLPEVFLEHDR